MTSETFVINNYLFPVIFAVHFSALTTSSEQSDPGSKSSSYGSLHAISNTVAREPRKNELNERFRLTLNRSVDFLTTADESPSASELQLTKRIFSILLQGICGPLGKRSYWINAWSVKPALRKNAAKIMVWLMGPHQNNSTRVYAVRCLMDQPKTREILSTLLEVHPQVIELLMFMIEKFVVSCSFLTWNVTMI